MTYEMHFGGTSVKTTSIEDAVCREAPAWRELAHASSTVGRIVDGKFHDLSEDAIPLAMKLAERNDLPHPYVECVYLGVLVDADYAGPRVIDQRRFGELIGILLKHRYIRYAKLGPAMSLPLAGSRAALLAYTFSDFTRGELNALLNVEAFIKEGELPQRRWPVVPGPAPERPWIR